MMFTVTQVGSDHTRYDVVSVCGTYAEAAKVAHAMAPTLDRGEYFEVGAVVVGMPTEEKEEKEATATQKRKTTWRNE